MLRVALCQINTTIGAFSQNLDRCIEFLRKAGDEGAELAVFPELTFASYPPLDLLDRPGFIRASREALQAFEKRLSSTTGLPGTVVVGSIIENPSPQGRAIQNAAIIIQDGKTARVQAKQLLPTYDVFDEARYFQPGSGGELFESKWGKLGLAICEDCWFDDAHMGRKIYAKDPASDLRGAALIINTSASPFHIDKRQRRQEMFSGFVRRVGAPMVFVNQVGGNDEILFDGASAVFGVDGKVHFELPAFRECVGVVDLDLKSGKAARVGVWTVDQNAEPTGAGSVAGWKALEPAKPGESSVTASESEVLREALVVGIRDYFRKTGFSRTVLGLSGGIDSAVVAALAAEALGPRNVLGIAMPSQYSSPHSLADAELLAKNIGIEFRVHPIKFAYSTVLMELKPAFQGAPADFTEENVQARLRALVIMAMANKRRALALTTGNKSELGVGFCTMYGDMAGALAPLGDIYKTRVYAIARAINARHAWIPESCITKAPSAELRPGQTDQDTLPPYELLDRILELHFEELADRDEIVRAGLDAATVDRVLAMVKTSEFKRRQSAPVLKVSHKAFGLGRRIPVAKAY